MKVIKKTGVVDLSDQENLENVICGSSEKLWIYIHPASPIYKKYHDLSLIHIEPIFTSKISSVGNIPARYYVTGWAINSIAR